MSSESRNSVSTCTKALLACERHIVAPGYERVSVVGEIDLATGSQLADVLCAAQARAQRVVLDMGGATFIDVGGVRVLLAADLRARAQAGTFAIARPTSSVERVLHLVGADRALAILRLGIAAPKLADPIRSAPRSRLPLRARRGSDTARSAASRSG
jgi:anti-anti-sigma factor